MTNKTPVIAAEVKDGDTVIGTIIETERTAGYPMIYMVARPTDLQDTFFSLDRAKVYVERHQPALKKYGEIVRWGGTSRYTDALCWEQNKHKLGMNANNRRQYPVQTSTYLPTALKFAEVIEPPDCRMYACQVGEKTWHYEFWDEANLWCLPWVMRAQLSQHTAKSYIAREFGKHKHLHDGVFEAWHYYRTHGIAAKPDWVPDNSLYEIAAWNGKRTLIYQRLRDVKAAN